MTNYENMSRDELIARLQRRESGMARSSEVERATVRNWSWGRTGSDCLEDLNYEVTKEEIQLVSSGAIIPNRVAITRKLPSGEDYVFDVGSDSYATVQNRTMIDLANCIAETDSAEITNAGIVGMGEQCFVQMKRPPHSIVGEEHQDSIVILWGHDRSRSIRLFTASFRIACFNAMAHAIENARGQQFNLRHTRNVHDKIDDIRLAVQFAQRRRAIEAERAEYLASSHLTGTPLHFFERFADGVIETRIGNVPITYEAIRTDSLASEIRQKESPDRELLQRSYDRALRARSKVVAELQERFESDRNNGHPVTGGTLWSLAQTATEFVNHSPLLRYQGSEMKRRDAKFLSMVSGKAARLNDSAFNLALQMAS